MAEQLAQGGYGVNAGEYASASSSILYSFLLTPFAGTELHRYLPLPVERGGRDRLGRVLGDGCGPCHGGGPCALGAGRWWRGVVPIFLNIAGVAMTGMEHGLHTAVCLMLLVGLIDMAVTGRLNWLLIAGAVLGRHFASKGWRCRC